MQVVVAYTNLHPIAKAVAETYGAIFAPTIGPGDYFELLDDQWLRGEGTVVVEQDVLPWGLEPLIECPQPWCVRPYMVASQRCEQGLGCTKFSAALQQRMPDLVARSAVEVDPPGRDWRGLDARIAYMIRNSLGVYVHQHEPTIHFGHGAITA